MRVRSEYLELWLLEEEDKLRATPARHAGNTRQKTEQEKRKTQTPEEELLAERRQGA